MPEQKLQFFMKKKKYIQKKLKVGVTHRIYQADHLLAIKNITNQFYINTKERVLIFGLKGSFSLNNSG